jgi:catechol 2,3-dioxygenase-like lactoylglutathione lyase family enzyme
LADDLIPTVRSVVINTPDEERLAAFWAELLGVEVAHSTEGFLWLKPQRPGAFSIAFQRVANPTEGRRRLHLDTSVSDLEAATARIIAIGGSHIEDHEIPGFAWRVMADPDGNEFCIAPEEH